MFSSWPARTVRSVSEMQALAAEMARELRGGAVLLLYGELGSGKTTFVQGLARALGVTEQVTSPSFTIAADYPVAGHETITRLVHVDLYRLDAPTAARDPAVADVLESAAEAGRLTVIEWADRLGEPVLAGARRLYFRHGREPSERVVDYEFGQLGNSSLT